MYSVKKIDGSESSTAKGVNIKYKLRNIKQKLMKLIKNLYHVLMIKDLYQMMEFIFELIFIKIVIKKDCNDEKRL